MGPVRQENQPSLQQPGHRRPRPQRRSRSCHDESGDDRVAGAPMYGAGIPDEKSRNEIGVWQVGTDKTDSPGLPGLGHAWWNERKRYGTPCQSMTNR